MVRGCPGRAPYLLFFWLYYRDHAKVVYFGYYVPGFMLYVSGMLIAILGILLWGAERIIPRPQRWMALPACELRSWGVQVARRGLGKHN